MCIKIIRLYFHVLTDDNKWVREHYSAHCALMKWSDCTAQENIDPHAPAPLSSQRECILRQFCAAVLSQDAFFMPQLLWQPGWSSGKFLIQHCLWWTESVFPQMLSTCNTVRMLQWGEYKKKKVHYLYLPNTHGCPYWAAVIQESSTLIRIMWLIN